MSSTASSGASKRLADSDRPQVQRVPAKAKAPSQLPLTPELRGAANDASRMGGASAWAKPEELSFMRQAPEETLRERWKSGRKDARLAYRKLHEDTMRQRRKDHARRA